MRALLHLFPGQGIQKVGMHKGLPQEQYLKLVSQIPNLQEYIENGPQEQLNQTEYAQPAIFLASYLMYQPKQNVNQYAIGHSVGEYAALTIARCFQPEQTIKLLHQRGIIMRDCTKKRKMGMLAVQTEQNIDEIIKNVKTVDSIIEPALYNSKTQTVYSGDVNALQKLQSELKKLRINSLFLNVSAAFHCSLLTPGKQILREHIEKYLIFKESNIKVIRNLDAQIYSSREHIIEGLTEQLDHPVKFKQSIEYLRQITDFESIEYGSSVLSKLI